MAHAFIRVQGGEVLCKLQAGRVFSKVCTGEGSGQLRRVLFTGLLGKSHQEFIFTCDSADCELRHEFQAGGW